MARRPNVLDTSFYVAHEYKGKDKNDLTLNLCIDLKLHFPYSIPIYMSKYRHTMGEEGGTYWAKLA